MNSTAPWDGNEVVVSSDSSASWGSDTDMKDVTSEIKPIIKTDVTQPALPAKELTSEDTVTRRAEMYQEYMKQIPIPTRRGSTIPFTTWQGLAQSIKQLYRQPLHYLTNTILKQWDKSRIGADNEYQPLDEIIQPRKAEATIWFMEEVHRRTSSHHHLAQLWLSDPMHHAFVDPIFTQI